MWYSKAGFEAAKSIIKKYVGGLGTGIIDGCIAGSIVEAIGGALQGAAENC